MNFTLLYSVTNNSFVKQPIYVKHVINILKTSYQMQCMAGMFFFFLFFSVNLWQVQLLIEHMIKIPLKSPNCFVFVCLIVGLCRCLPPLQPSTQPLQVGGGGEPPARTPMRKDGSFWKGTEPPRLAAGKRGKSGCRVWRKKQKT